MTDHTDLVRRLPTICACGHDRDHHYRPLHRKAPDSRCAMNACDCVEFVVYVPDGNEP